MKRFLTLLLKRDRKIRGKLVLAILLSLVAVVTQLLTPRLFAEALDLLTLNHDLPGFVRYLVITVGAVLLAAVFLWAKEAYNRNLSLKILENVRNACFEKALFLPIAEHDKRSPGDLLALLSHDVERFSEGLFLLLDQFFTALLSLALILGIIFYNKPAIAVILLLLSPVSLIVARFIASHSFHYFHMQKSEQADQAGFLEERLGAQEELRAMGGVAATVTEFNALSDKLCEASRLATFYASLTNPVTRAVNALAYAAIAFASALFVLKGTLTLGMMTAFLAYTRQFSKPFNEITAVFSELQTALAAGERIADFLALDNETDRGTETLELQGAPEIRFQNIDFSYPTGPQVLHDLSVTVPRGKRLAIVGTTGSGKTTLVQLLVRFYDPQRGEITLDGADIEAFTKRSLRAHIAMVPQDSLLTTASLHDNIAYARPGATRAEVVAAAANASADPWIRQLPGGYDYVLKSGGKELSEGQRQAIALARVFLSERPILILDEASSALDPLSEARIQRALDELFVGRTAIIVAHRLSTIEQADVIAVMDQGKIIEFGTHEELLEADGYYALMHREQSAAHRGQNRL